MRLIFAILINLSFILSSHAGFQRWSTEIKSNPFSGGKDIDVLFNASRTQQVQVTCNSSKSGIQFVAIPGFELPSSLAGEIVDVKIAVDGAIVVADQKGVVSAFGANLAGVVIPLDKNSATKVTEAMINATRQIAISDGISTQPFLLNARGSTKAGKSLNECLAVQKGDQEDVSSEINIEKDARITEIKKKISDLEVELRKLESQ